MVSASNSQIECIENGHFYRNPDRPTHKSWTSVECSKYHLCLEGEVFDFKCSSGLLFDIKRQICDLKSNVNNCNVTTPEITPSLDRARCRSNELGCGDGTCLPQHYFCDGSLDCPDGSDEKSCDSLNDVNSALPCNPSTCAPPDCFCSTDGTAIPGRLDPLQTPQMVLLTFEDAINSENFELLDKILSDARKNPNGCPTKATFFVSHQYNNYHQTQRLWNQGHEIAVHSVTHRGPKDWWSADATLEDWFDEMVGQANILHRFARIRLGEIRGMRAPFLQIGWNRQFLMMKEFGFVYDSSVVAPFSDPPLWPYTLDHAMPHDCIRTKQKCPTRSYPGVWEMVLNQMEVDSYSCAMLDSCRRNLTGDDLYRVLIHNFKRHYLTNRAPFGLHFHATWFQKREYFDALQDFVAEILQQPDVWFVTNSQAVSWMKSPTPVGQLNSFRPWGCERLFHKNEIACNVPNICKLHSRMSQEDRYLYTCHECPKSYPWIRNEFGFDYTIK